LQKELGIIAKSTKLARLQNEMDEMSLLTVNGPTKESVTSKSTMGWRPESKDLI
jgi:hypothetical protein